MKTFLFFVCCMVAVNAWSSLEIVARNPALPKTCTSKQDTVGTMKYGEVKRLATRCGTAACSPGMIVYTGCIDPEFDEPCQLVPEDLSKPFPKCCSEVICP
ncbi:hypothetical protein FQA39_LY04583 [Lamprigera yunnana]|nr:hypothetical protein FQA39_LY04583 [Lamprigera yunnana]